MNGDPYITDYSQTYTEFGLRQSKLWPSNTLCMTIAGANTAKTAILKFEACFPDSIVGFIPDGKKADLHFVKYSLDLMKQKFLAVTRGATQDNLSLDKLLSFPIPTPPLQDQRRIAGILSAYDDLIENNQRRIKILEEMARSLYREWFVNFRYPGHEKVPLVDSPLGLIPKGWEVKKLGDIVGYDRRATKPGPHLDERRYVPIDCLPSKSLALLQAKPIEEAQSSLQLFEKGDILFGAMRPYFHKVVIAPFAGVTRTTCFVFKPARPEWHAFATMTAFEETTVAYANAHSQGATIPYAVWDGSLAEMPLVLAPDALLRRFEKVVAPMLVRISQSFFALNNLRRTRDLLLPRLLSGQICLESVG
jgi:type I restriction enzyme, S subunit